MAVKLDFQRDQKKRLATSRGSLAAYSDLETPGSSLPFVSNAKRRQVQIVGLKQHIIRLERTIRSHGKKWSEANLQDAENELARTRKLLEHLQTVDQKVANLGSLQKSVPLKGRTAIIQKLSSTLAHPTEFEKAVEDFLIKCAEAKINGTSLPKPSIVIQRRYKGLLLDRWIKMTLCGGLFKSAMKKSSIKA